MNMCVELHVEGNADYVCETVRQFGSSGVII
jgi:hypothetical protein